MNVNKKLRRLLDFIYKQDPDVVCLQELPESFAEQIRDEGEYHVEYTYDFVTESPHAGATICTLSKKSPVRSTEISYFEKGYSTLMDTLIYKKLRKTTELHKAVLTEFQESNIVVINARLSCAIGTCDRLEQFENILKTLDKTKINILCGDFNIMDSRLFNILTGWGRGFRKPDYLTNERKTFDKLCEEYGFVNVFKGQSTHMLRYPMKQLDHILVPKGVSVSESFISRFRNGSDHKMLVVSLDI